ncbi:SCO1664 family protein [Kineococcus sp. TRM81007]|uniref:SCO1664 family protein n=1 Tax=Kineococcus sp. TRM81007 TaxID=2925831 RepID=UPI001F5A3028|nr:SCO1664 family protein [Kineococcus sp. TRM81007]MCI2237691.1 SCO1664 family protein [Kineococcus sp. TRM81007]
MFAGVPEADALVHLAAGELRVRGRLADASNATLYSVVASGGAELACVYKPVAGERPLWDFPDDTLARREVASYAVSAATGWDVVPPTVLRDGPLGPGSVQLWLQAPPEEAAGPAELEELVEVDGFDGAADDGALDAADEGADDDQDADHDDRDDRDDHVVVLPQPGAGLVDITTPRELPPGWLPVLHAEDYSGRPVVLAHADDPRLRRIAVLDAVLNNADRKGGHVLPGWGGAVHGVDHGLTFHAEPKLRTVLWGWGGEALDEHERDVLERLRGDLGERLGEVLTDLLSVEEAVATLERVERLLRTGRLPRPRGQRTIPWPPF